MTHSLKHVAVVVGLVVLAAILDALGKLTPGTSHIILTGLAGVGLSGAVAAARAETATGTSSIVERAVANVIVQATPHVVETVKQVAAKHQALAENIQKATENAFGGGGAPPGAPPVQ